MSLTGQLAVGPLAAWCAATLTGTAAVAADVATALATSRPIRPTGHVTAREHWATIGGAHGQRLAFATAHAPPYYALLGAHRAGLADWATIQACAARFPTHTGLAPDRAARANQMRPLPAGGGWLDLDTEPSATHGGRATTGTRPDLVTDLARRLVAYLAAHAPPGRAGTRGAEAVLARACVVLTDLESAYRGGRLPAAAAARWADPATTIDTLLAAVPDDQVAELVELTARADTTGTLAHLAGGTPGPVFVEHWADGDLLTPPDPTNHGATTLLDVKTIAAARDPHRVGRWLWQLLAYAWLDTGDRHHIRAVGLHLARHGVTITWPLPELTAALAPGRDPDTTAARFRDLAAQLLAEETGLAPTAPR